MREKPAALTAMPQDEGKLTLLISLSANSTVYV
jgi:hypothetical protein